MEEKEKRSKAKSRQELFKEFVNPKIIELLEKMRAEDSEYKKVVKNEFSYSEQKKLLKNLSDTPIFKKAIEDWKKEFDKINPSNSMQISEANRKKILATSGLKKADNTEIEFF